MLKQIDKMSDNELRGALKLQRIALLAIAQSCDSFRENTRNTTTQIEYEAIAEQARSDADRFR